MNFAIKVPMKLMLLGTIFGLLASAMALKADVPTLELLRFCKVVEKGDENSEELPNGAFNADQDAIVVDKTAALDLKDIEEVFTYSKTNPVQEYVISVKFSEEGAKKFAVLTKEQIGKRLAIVVKNKVVAAPMINESIGGGRAIISGNFTETAAKALVAEINEVLKK